MKITRLFSIFGLASFLAACGGVPSESSSLDGHYENTTAEEMEKYRNAQFVTPEYQPVEGVIVSSLLVSQYQRADLIEEIFRAGANRVWVKTPLNRDVNQVRQSAPFRNLASRISRIPSVNENGSINYRDRNADLVFVPHAADPTKSLNSTNSGDSVWARDWAPLGATILNDAFENDLHLLDFNYYSDRPVDDASPQALDLKKPSWARVSVPVYNEGGNFMNNDDGLCMMTNRVVEANQLTPHPRDQVWNAEEIKQFYRDFAGCSHVEIIDRMPHEGTGHIDMFARFLDNDTIMIAEIQDRSLQIIKDLLNRPGLSLDQQRSLRLTLQVSEEIQAYLESQAEHFSTTSFMVGNNQFKRYDVVRVPMPIPNVWRESFLGQSVISGVFRSYTNSLTVNQTAIIPQYIEGTRVDYLDQHLRSDYEREVTQVYESSGYRAVYIPSDGLINIGGAVHCVTMQLPKL